jgi:hypothetical protein
MSRGYSLNRNAEGDRMDSAGSLLAAELDTSRPATGKVEASRLGTPALRSSAAVIVEAYVGKQFCRYVFEKEAELIAGFGWARLLLPL